MISIEQYRLWFMDVIYDENKENVYFSAANTSDLYRCNLHTKEVDKLGELRGVAQGNQLYRGGLIIKKRLYLSPRMAEKMAVVDLDTEMIQYIDVFEGMKDIGGEDNLKPNNQGFLSVKDSGGNGWLVFRNSPICLKIGSGDNNLSFYTCPESGRECIIGTEYIIAKDKVYAPVKGSNHIFSLDMSSGVIKLMAVGEESDRYYSITQDESGKIFLLSYSNPGIVSWDAETNHIERIVDLPLKSIAYESDLLIRCVGAVFIIIPGLDLSGVSGDSFIVERETKSIRKMDWFRKYKSFRKSQVFFDDEYSVHYMVPSGEDLYFSVNGRLVCFDYRKKTIFEFSIPVPKGETEKSISDRIRKYQLSLRYRNCYDSAKLHIEDNYLGLDGFLVGLKNDD